MLMQVSLAYSQRWTGIVAREFGRQECLVSSRQGCSIARMQNRWATTVVGLVVVGAGALLAQSHPEVADAGKAWAQKTPWGDPDLSGAWTSDD